MVVLGLSGSGLFGAESSQTVGAFADQTGASFPLLLGDSTYFQYETPAGAISPYPLDVIVAPDGRIAYLSNEFEPEAMTAIIESLLAG